MSTIDPENNSKPEPEPVEPRRRRKPAKKAKAAKKAGAAKKTARKPAGERSNKKAEVAGHHWPLLARQ